MNKILLDSLFILHTGSLGRKFLFPYVTKEISISNRISVISVSNNRNKNILHEQLKKSNIKVLNYSENFFENSCKIDSYYYLLQKVDTEYSLLCDAFDVIIMRDLQQDFINIFESFNRDIVFSRDGCRFPVVNVHGIENDMTYALNSGIIFGKTKSLLDLYQHLYNFKKEHYNEEPKELRKSDQYWIRYYLSKCDKNNMPNYCLDNTLIFCTTHRDPEIIDKKYFTSFMCKVQGKDIIEIERKRLRRK